MGDWWIGKLTISLADTGVFYLTMSDSTSNTRKFVASALGHVGTQNKHVNSSGDAGLQDYQVNACFPPILPNIKLLTL